MLSKRAFPSRASDGLVNARRMSGGVHFVAGPEGKKVARALMLNTDGELVHRTGVTPAHESRNPVAWCHSLSPAGHRWRLGSPRTRAQAFCKSEGFGPSTVLNRLVNGPCLHGGFNAIG